MQHTERRRHWSSERQNLKQGCQNAIFSDEPRFCVQYSDGRICFWRLRGDRLSLASIRYRHKGPAPSEMIWEAIGTRHVHL